MNWDTPVPNAAITLLIELQGRLERRHLPDERWQRGCIREVVKRLRFVRKGYREKAR